MTSQEAAERVQAELGPLWPRDRPVPRELLALLCEALWQEGINPNRRIVQQRLLVVNDHAVGPGVVAWRKAKGLPEQGIHSPHPLPTNLQELAKIISSPIAEAPYTCFDPSNDGRWPVPPPNVLRYLGRIENRSVRDAMALVAILRPDRSPRALYSLISNFTYILRRLMNEQRIEDVTSINPDDLLFRVYAGEAGKGLTEDQRRTAISQWNAMRNVFEEYAERLSPERRELMSHFFIQPLTDRRKLLRLRPYTTYHREQQERVKRKADAVHPHFYRIRYVAGARLNQARRFYEATKAAVAFVEAHRLSYPHEFSYEETVQIPQGRAVRQRVELTLWDRISLWDHAVALGYHEGPTTRMQRRWRQGSFSDEKNCHYVEYNATKSLVKGVPPERFWFLEIFRHRAFRHTAARTDSDLSEKRQAFFQQWGYTTHGYWEDAGVLTFGSKDYRPLDFVQAREGHEFLPYEGIYAATLFGGVMIRMGTIAGARVGESQQIAQSPECFKRLDNVGPKAATRWVLRLIPKGRRERLNYFIDEETKCHLMEVIRFLGEKHGGPLIPVVETESRRTPPDRYLLQWGGRGLTINTLSAFIRFVLHGVVLRSIDGSPIQLSSHLLRHAFATTMAELKVPIDIIAQILHQRDKTVTQYYARPTATQVMNAAEMMFVDRIDVAAEALRSPEEIGRRLKEAEGKLGALTEVFGGTCVIANMCPAKFACVGCAGNAPDPSKRYQIKQKKAWAEQQLRYAVREKLAGEERTLKQLITDCKLVMQEMDLIEAARADQAQTVSVCHGGTKG
jgi:hypothetical protein